MIIGGLSKQSKWRKAMELLEGLETEFHLTPTTAIYNAVISSLAKSGELGQAKNLLFKMRKGNISPNTYTYNALLSACAKNARWKDALSLLEMCHQEPGLKPDVISYTHAIRYVHDIITSLYMLHCCLCPFVFHVAQPFYRFYFVRFPLNEGHVLEGGIQRELWRYWRK
jgi:pentatricopeptide repeat protein